MQYHVKKFQFLQFFNIEVNSLFDRDKYLNEILSFRDKDLIKVITGLRRCGKSTLLDLVQERLMSQGVPASSIVTFQMESMEFDGIEDYRDLYSLIEGRIQGIDHPYLFFDELQEVKGWERAVNSLRVDHACDIYLTGSNAYLLSSELSTLISGRYVEIEMLPLVFSEYLDFRQMRTFPAHSDRADIALDAHGEPVSLRQLFEQFRQYGGLPFLALSEPDVSAHRIYCRSLCETVIVRDILERDRRSDRRGITNPELLRKLFAFLADNIGGETSVNSIANALRAGKVSAANSTIDAYIAALRHAYLFYEARRFDVKGKRLLQTNSKNYIADLGLRSYLDDYRDSDYGRTLENIVYLQLLYDGFLVSVGKLRNGEIDFIARKPGERIYVQVTENMEDAATREREVKPLLAVGDAYPKLIIVAEGHYPQDINGIKVVSIIDFLLHR